MSNTALAAGVRRLRGLAAAQRRTTDSDEQLLCAFTDRHDESAFAALVRRHGPMVAGVCRRVLGHEQDAEDAFQATFLVLARRAAHLRNKTALASFLHGTAYRLALMTKRSAGRRRKHERQASPQMPANPSGELLWREVQAILDEEIKQLPERLRCVFVLCCLESLSRAEAARRLNLKEGTVSSRLTAARQRLQQRLKRRGIELTALLAATALTAETASALPAALVSKTIRGSVSPAVAALAAQGLPLVSKVKLALVLTLALVLASGVALAPGGISPPRGTNTAPLTAQARGADTAPPAQRDAPKAKEIHGRVLDPDGQPKAGAKLLLVGPDGKTTKLGTTAADGRFAVAIPKDAKNSSGLVAWADGFGMNWTELPSRTKSTDLTLRLVADQAIHGHVLTTEGKPLAGVRVRVVSLVATPEERLDGLLNLWKHAWNNFRLYPAVKQLDRPEGESSFETRTDAQGRFHFHGLGRERMIHLEVNGPGIAQGLLYVITRPSFDSAAYNRAVQDLYPPGGHRRGWPPLLYGPTLTYVADPERPIEGTVREAGSGKPAAGVTVSYMVNFLNSIRAVTDAKGRFRLAGAAKEPQYWLQVDPGPDAPWVSTALVAEDNKGFQPLHVDIKVARGTIVTGRVHDKATGQGVPSELHIVPLPQNTFVGKPGLEFRALQLPTATDGEGRFRLVAPPGRCVLLARARNRDTVIGNSAINPQKTINPYREAEFTAEERKLVSLHKTPEGHRFFETASGEKREYLANSNACTVLDLSEDASALTRDLVVDRGRTLTIHLRDGDGKPVVGCLAGGLTATEADNPALPEASCTVYALDPGRPRQVAFVQPERHLAGLATVRGDEKEPLTVRLLPTGVVTGRLLDASGQPVRGAWVHLYYDGNRTVTVVDGPLRVQQERDVTDRDGRFRLETIFPNVAFRMVAPRVQKTYLEVDPPVANKKVSPGQTLDLGDLRTKPLN